MLLPIGIAIFALGLIGVIYGILQRIKAGRLMDAPLVTTGDIAMRGRAVAGAKGQVSAQGSVVCPQPVIAPFSGQPCLFYSIKCTAKWKEGDHHKSKLIDEKKQAASFTIDDGSGPVVVDAREGGDFEPTQRKAETKGTGLIGGITGTEMQFGNYQVNTPMLDVGTKYEVEEEILPIVPRLYACGRIGDPGNAIAAPNWRQLILSNRTRDELLASATKTAKISLIVGALALLGGGGSATAGTLMAQQAAAKEPPASSSSPVASSAPTPASAPPAPPIITPSALPSAAPTTSIASTPPPRKKKKRKKPPPPTD
jgi:hypothetical protein